MLEMKDPFIMVQNSNHVKVKPDIFDENNSSVCEKKERDQKRLALHLLRVR